MEKSGRHTAQAGTSLMLWAVVMDAAVVMRRTNLSEENMFQAYGIGMNRRLCDCWSN